MSLVSVNQGQANLHRTVEISSKLEHLIKKEPGYLAAVLEPNSGTDPRFSVEAFPNFVWFLEPRSEAKDGKVIESNALRRLPSRMNESELHVFRKGDASSGILGFIPTSKSLEMLGHLAHSYMHRGMPIIEGGTSLGKTYAVRGLVKLIYGNNAKPLHFYCDGQTDTSELLAKYVPAAHDPAALKVSQFLGSKEGEAWLSAQYADGKFSDKTGPDRILFDAAVHLQVVLNKNSFTFSLGAIPKAAMAQVGKNGEITIDENNPGSGTVLLIDEVGLAKGPVILALLRMRGDGELVKSFQLWEDSGRNIPIGQNCFIAFATNTLKYADRQPVDAALARSLNWKRLGELEDNDISEFIHLITQHDYGQRGTVYSDTQFLDITKYPELYTKVGKAIFVAHSMIQSIAGGAQAGGDRQKIPCTYEDILKALKYCNSSQVLDGTRVDMVKTVLEAVKTQYFERISDRLKRTEQINSFERLINDRNGTAAVKILKNGKEVSASLALAIATEFDKAWKVENESLSVIDSDTKKELEKQEEIRQQKNEISEFFSTIVKSQRTATSIIEFCKLAKAQYKEESMRELKNALGALKDFPATVNEGAEDDNQINDMESLEQFKKALIEFLDS